MTGCLPLLFRSLFAFQDKQFDEAEFLKSKELQLVNRDIVSFYENLLADNISDARRRQ
jgi:hypothetical protein